MYIKNGIAYAGEEKPRLSVCGVRPMQEHKLWVRFSTGEAKIYDLSPLLDSQAFSPLKDKALFDSVYIDYGVPAWMDGQIDIAPDILYADGIAAEA